MTETGADPAGRDALRILLENLPDPELALFTPPSAQSELAPAQTRVEVRQIDPPSIAPAESARPPAMIATPGFPASVRIDGDLDGNRVEVEPSDRHVRLVIVLRGKGNTVIVRRDCALDAILSAADGAHIEIGARTEMQGAQIIAREGARCIVGARCRFSTNTRLQSPDPYAVFDAKTQERLNPPRPIVIEDEVWLSDYVQIARGTTIGAGSVVNASSILSGDYPAGALIAGRPGRVVRTGIRWQP